MATTQQQEPMARATKKEQTAMVRVSPTTSRMLKDLKSAMGREGATMDDLVRELVEAKLSPEMLSEAKRRRAILEADDLEIDLSDELDPVMKRLAALEERLALFIAKPGGDGVVIDVAAVKDRGVDGDAAKGGRGAFVITPWAPVAGLHERDKDIPPAVAAFLHREAKEKADAAAAKKATSKKVER